MARSRTEGFEIYSQSIVSPGDGGISYGQAVVAAARLKRQQQNSNSNRYEMAKRKS